MRNFNFYDDAVNGAYKLIKDNRVFIKKTLYLKDGKYSYCISSDRLPDLQGLF